MWTQIWLKERVGNFKLNIQELQRRKTRDQMKKVFGTQYHKTQGHLLLSTPTPILQLDEHTKFLQEDNINSQAGQHLQQQL